MTFERLSYLYKFKRLLLLYIYMYEYLNKWSDSIVIHSMIIANTFYTVLALLNKSLQQINVVALKQVGNRKWLSFFWYKV